MSLQADVGYLVETDQSVIADVSDIHHHADMDELITCDSEHMDDSFLMLLDDSLDDIIEDGISQECNMKTCWHYQYCTAYIIILLGIVMVVATVVFVVITVLVVVPYSHVASFTESICQVKVDSTYIGEYICSCGKGCNSRYPCINIIVYVSGTNSDGYNASLHSNEVSLDKEVITHDILWACNVLV